MSFAFALLGLLLMTERQSQRESFEVYLCPLHPDEQATGAGRCRLCGAELELRSLTRSYSCPMHANVDEAREGKCPICGMTLVPTTRELQWFCPGKPEILSSTPGRCPDGSPMETRTVARAHGDHNPRHGGLLFMAPNGYHHLEGTLDKDGTFRVYLYDDFTRPIPVDGFEGRAGDVTMEPSLDGGFLGASLPGPLSDPAEVVLHLRFPGDSSEEARFDFIFASERPVTLALAEFRIPETSEAIYEEILRRDLRLKELIRKGAWPDLYIPALEAKDLVLALTAREEKRVGRAAKKLVRAAWLLDTYGDMGNRLEVEAAYRLFEEGIRARSTAYAP